MQFDIITIFPDFFRGPLDYGIVRRARESGLVNIAIHDLRAFTHDRHNTVDDRPFGGGEGMVLKPEPIFEAVESIVPKDATREELDRDGTAIILLSASGRLFRQKMARAWAQLHRSENSEGAPPIAVTGEAFSDGHTIDHKSRHRASQHPAQSLIFICGRYEGVDERVTEHLATDEISIGDFVLSGGELAAALIVDAVTRLLPGALGNEASAIHESFSEPDQPADSASNAGKYEIAGQSAQSTQSIPPQLARGFLDCPHYTRPPEFRGWQAPEVLLGGNHEEIRIWRRKMALRKTLRNRPDLLSGATLSHEDRRLLQDLRAER